jgi:hypothetical protein
LVDPSITVRVNGVVPVDESSAKVSPEGVAGGAAGGGPCARAAPPVTAIGAPGTVR